MESLSEQDGILTTKKVPAAHQTCRITVLLRLNVKPGSLMFFPVPSSKASLKLDGLQQMTIPLNRPSLL